MKKFKVLAAMMMIAAMLVGCGGKEVPMKEFSPVDGSYSIQMNEKWVVEDMGMENWVAAFNELGTEGAMVMQFPMEMVEGTVSDLAGFKALIESSYVMSDMEAIEADSSILSNLEAYTCSMDVDNLNGEGCVAYGETEYAYYVILSVTGTKLSDGDVEAFKKSVASLTEVVQ